MYKVAVHVLRLQFENKTDVDSSEKAEIGTLGILALLDASWVTTLLIETYLIDIW